jgi:hypothetical protein
VLREAQKNPAEMARDPFAGLRPPTKWLKEKTFDVFVVAPGKMLIDPVTNGTQWLINGLRTKATDAMRCAASAASRQRRPNHSRWRRRRFLISDESQQPTNTVRAELVLRQAQDDRNSRSS